MEKILRFSQDTSKVPCLGERIIEHQSQFVENELHSSGIKPLDGYCCITMFDILFFYLLGGFINGVPALLDNLGDT